MGMLLPGVKSRGRSTDLLGCGEGRQHVVFAPGDVQGGRFLEQHSGGNIQLHVLHTLWATKAAQGGGFAKLEVCGIVSRIKENIVVCEI